MRALIVVVASEVIERALLLGHRLRWLLGRALLEGAVKPLETSVLLGVSGLDALGNDTELDPPNAQRRQAAQCFGGKGRPVIASDPSRNPELRKRALEVRTR